MKRLFFGGIHPRGKKAMSASVPTLHSVVPNEVVIPLKQHVGVACTPLVQVGDRVLRGQKIGDGEGLCVPVHASVAGTVTAIEERRMLSGQTVLSVVIQSDKTDEAVAATGDPLPLDGTDEAILHAIREAGLVGMGGAAFPGDIKAIAALGKIDHLIANACECEPYITADDALLRSDPVRVLKGLQLMQKVLRPERTVLAVEDNKQDAITVLREAMVAFADIELVVLPTRYPQGSEKQLIQAVTGREVPSGKLPADVGCVVFNVTSFAAMATAVYDGQPLTERIVTVTGEAVAKPQNLLVRLGTPIEALIEAAGGLTADADRVISGGPMMGFAQADLAAPVVKATGAVLCLPKEKHAPAGEHVCVRCGKCMAVCPMGLQPLYLHRFAAAGDVEELRRLHILDCMECGSCAYTCPGKLDVVELLRRGKQLVREAEKEEQV